MEKLNSKKPIHWDYSKVMDIVYLSLARKDDLSGSLSAKSFESLFPNEVDRRVAQSEFGARFDDEIVGLVVSAMALQQRSLVIDMGDDIGMYDDNKFFWEDKLEERLDILKNRQAFNKSLTVELIKFPLTLEGCSEDPAKRRHIEDAVLESERGILAA